MADDESARFAAGQSALVVPVPEAEPRVRDLRNRFDPAARAGVPAHITVVFPFLHGSLVDATTCAALDEIFGRHQYFDVRFDKCGRFPGVLYLAPVPDDPLRRLTDAVVARWPEVRPYGGKYEPHPHLTVAQGQDDTVLDEIESELQPALPFTARVPTVDLVVHNGTAWQHRASFALR
ncbi:2'-5' RNA ligase family protein [Streptomyces sp. NBC_00588]|jgi:2'-5' RNA ligase|uniref:2'-5' RNA ligase family protein n=1 Tax=Streptomyces sp. NBC_00588 TaxID=2975784 RepID=UPI002E8053BE|nr:2'-5' RNA ligase family protein [Streptomyces sp. NBC_00588]WUB34136.1 2'-5' RNA ligase family protein [Streptomyces sp. NBC_00588]